MHLRMLPRILTAQASSSIGTSVSTVALAFMVFKLTGSVLQMGGVMAVSTFPLVVTSFVGGAVLDRFSAKNVMVVSDLARAVLIFVMPFLAQAAVGLIYVVAALIGVFSALFNPGQIKLIGELNERRFLVRANSYLGVSRDGAELFGYLLGGVLVTFVGYTLTFSIDAASYLLSALLLSGLPKAVPRLGPAPRLGALIAESPAVVGRLWCRPGLRTNLLLATFATMAIMMSIPNSYGLALETFDRGAAGLAALEVLTASGLIVGGVIISRMLLQGDKNRYVSISLVTMGFCLVGVSFSKHFWVSIALLGLAGLANVGVFVPSITMFQETPADTDKGRLISLRAGFGQMGTTGGLLLGGILGAAVGITRLFLVAGVAGIGLTLVIYLPHRMGAARRARAARVAAVEAGARRTEARVAGVEAAMGTGTDFGTAWVAAAAAAEAKAAGSAASGVEPEARRTATGSATSIGSVSPAGNGASTGSAPAAAGAEEET
jgi:MFS family permease